MENREVLHIGVGRCGNNLVDKLIKVSENFVGVLYNTAANDVNALDSFIDATAGVFLIPNADGTGKDRDIAKEYAIKNRSSFEELLGKYSTSNNFVFYFSMDGGTGSGCTPELIRFVHAMYQDECTIHVVGAVRSKNASRVQLENTNSCWNELIALKEEGIIKSIMLIDNDSRDSIEEINAEAIEAISYAYSMKDLDYSGAIDTKDMSNYFNAVGYRTVYKLNNKNDNFIDSLEKAIEESVFLKPDKYEVSQEFIESVNNSILLNEEEKKIKLEGEKGFMYKCDQLLAVIQRTRYKIGDVLKTIKTIVDSKIGEQDVNIVGLSGMDMPLYKFNEVISRLKMASLDLNIKKKEMTFYNEEIIKEDSEPSKAKGRRNAARKRKSIDEILNKDVFRPKSK